MPWATGWRMAAAIARRDVTISYNFWFYRQLLSRHLMIAAYVNFIAYLRHHHAFTHRLHATLYATVPLETSWGLISLLRFMTLGRTIARANAISRQRCRATCAASLLPPSLIFIFALLYGDNFWVSAVYAAQMTKKAIMLAAFMRLITSMILYLI